MNTQIPVRLVPVQPTPEMLNAPDAAGVGLYSRETFTTIWTAMLEAAPASPLPGGGWQDMTCDEQFALATEIAANIGYVLQPEPNHPDCPHARQGMAKILRDQLNDKSRRLRPLPAAPTGDARNGEEK